MVHFVNRVESAHARLKRFLKSSQENFESSWSTIHSLLELQHTEIKASFEKSLTVVQHIYKAMEFRELKGFISISALYLIFTECKRVNSVGVDVLACGCRLRRTHGLPCAHEIAEYQRENRPIPLACIDSYWRKLDMLRNSNVQHKKLSCQAELDRISKRFEDYDDTMKIQLLKKLKELANPESSSLTEPEVKLKTRGRPKTKISTSTKRDPSAFEYVQYVHDTSQPEVVSLANQLQIPPKRRKKEKVIF